ncbi:MAG: LPP20 family lipoprotein [Campylobacterales bacterium]
MQSSLKKLALVSLLCVSPLVADDAALALEPQAAPAGVPFAPAAQNETPKSQNTAEMQGEFLIPNAPVLKPTNIITVRAIGLGVAPLNAVNRAQAMALAKRAAILDGYRQLGEKLHGIRINARDTVKDAMVTRSEIRTELYSVVRNAEVLETIWEDGLCQVEMEVRLDGRRWYRVLAGAL